MLEFHSAVEEIFDVQLLGGFQFPEVMGFQKDTLGHTFIVPDGPCPYLSGAKRSVPTASALRRIAAKS
jgi:hypothetical protein